MFNFDCMTLNQVSIVGDFSEEEIESCILDYLGTVKPTRGFEKAQKYMPITFRPSTADFQHQQVGGNNSLNV